jgi:hypothetical protein
MQRILMVVAFAAVATALVADSHPPTLDRLADQALQMLVARIDGLTPGQRDQIGALLHAAARQGQALQSDSRLTGPARKQQLGALVQATADKIRLLLNPDQRRQFDLAVRSMGRE